MLDKELEELKNAVTQAEAELEGCSFDKIDYSLAKYIKVKERFNKRLKSIRRD